MTPLQTVLCRTTSGLHTFKGKRCATCGLPEKTWRDSLLAALNNQTLDICPHCHVSPAQWEAIGETDSGDIIVTCSSCGARHPDTINSQEDPHFGPAMSSGFFTSSLGGNWLGSSYIPPSTITWQASGPVLICRDCTLALWPRGRGGNWECTRCKRVIPASLAKQALAAAASSGATSVLI